MPPKNLSSDNRHAFYNTVYQGNQGYSEREDNEVVFEKRKTEMAPFLDFRGTCLDLGCGRGVMSKISENYVGVDLSISALKGKNFVGVVASIEDIPFREGFADIIFSFHTLEHIENVESVLYEINRVLKPDGIIFLKPAWNCRSWNNKKLPRKPYSILTFQEKIEKALIPIRNSPIFRGLLAIPMRILRDIFYTLSNTPTTLHTKQLTPDYDYDEFWVSDADAITSMDPHELLWFFKSRQYEILSHPNFISRVLARSEGIACRKK